MDQKLIREKIMSNNRTIQALFSPNIFILNNQVAELLEENRKLQEMCQHEYDENGICIYCFKRI